MDGGSSTRAGQSEHMRWEVSAASAAPGDAVTFTATITNPEGEDMGAFTYLSPASPIFAPVGSSACTITDGPAGVSRAVTAGLCWRR
ncbi:hypothetical protein AB0395_33990 [Streptosporangium sp. NPDC051023]|uniref:hypothetical protein n=1 Tax=Streptosporangium sp. NPDC051023 TaxID=3155410 RepID=UPI00344B9F94